MNQRDKENIIRCDRIRSYTQVQSNSNPGGNTNRVNLPESIAAKQIGESADEYEHRISNEMTFALHPQMRSIFQR